MKTAVSFLIALVLMIPYGVSAQQAKTQAPAAEQSAVQQPAAQQPVAKKQAPKVEAAGPGMMGCPMMAHSKEMRAEFQKMMKRMDARLDAKVAVMNRTKGWRKVHAMAAVINELVAQRHEMREHMMKMREKWMAHKKELKVKGKSEGHGAVKRKGK